MSLNLTPGSLTSHPLDSGCEVRDGQPEAVAGAARRAAVGASVGARSLLSIPAARFSRGSRAREVLISISRQSLPVVCPSVDHRPDRCVRSDRR
jgi:hypothetical protein